MEGSAQHLRVLIANERQDRLAVVAPLVSSLGHEVIAREIRADEVGDLTKRIQPDVALVGVGHDVPHALRLIDAIVKESACPVIAILSAADDGFVREAAKLGVFAYIVDDDPATWQNMMEIVLRRFAEYQSLEGAFGRRAIIERAKGILMERHKIREDAAFSLIRDEARRSNRRVVDVAEAEVGQVVVAHVHLAQETERGGQASTAVRKKKPLSTSRRSVIHATDSTRWGWSAKSSAWAWVSRRRSRISMRASIFT